MNYKLILSFVGSDFCGWQFQPNSRTVQGTVTECARIILGDDATVTGASRTDSGVHSVGYVCTVKSEKRIEADNLKNALNANLPDDISVQSVSVVDDDFHPRYDALKKEYRYKIWNSKVKNPFLTNRAMQYKMPLDENKMNEYAKALIGRHDFRCFMAQGSKTEDTTREIYSADVAREGDLITFTVAGNGFLYNMVRIIVGTLIDLENGKINMTMDEIIESKDRKNAGFTSPAEGLYLWKVYYGKEDVNGEG